MLYTSVYRDELKEIRDEAGFDYQNSILHNMNNLSRDSLLRRLDLDSFFKSRFGIPITDEYYAYCMNSNSWDDSWCESRLHYSKREIAERLCYAFCNDDIYEFAKLIGMPKEYLEHWFYDRDGSKCYGQSPFHIITCLIRQGHTLDEISDALYSDRDSVREWYENTKPLYEEN